MRSVVALTVTLISLAMSSSLAVAQENVSARPRPAETVFVDYRVFGSDYPFRHGLSTLRPGEPRTIAEPSSLSYLIGVTETTDPETNAVARQPHIAKIDEGTRIDATVVGRTAVGATLDVSVQYTTITKVESRQDESGRAVQFPTIEIRKKRVVQFVEFDHTLVVPLDENDAERKMPKVEIFVGAGDVIRFDWTVPDELRGERDPERDAVFEAVAAAGGEVSYFYCAESKVDTWLNGTTREVLEIYAATVVELAHAFDWCGTPIRTVGALASILADELSTHAIEWEVLEGTTGSGQLHVMLRDSPSLLQDLKLLKRLPDLDSLVIYADDETEELRQAVSELHLEQVTVLKGAERGMAAVSLREYHTEDDGRDRPREKTVGVPALDAEVAIPHLKTMPKLEHVLIDVVRQEDEAQARKAQAALKQALPNAAIHVVLHTGDWPKK